MKAQRLYLVVAALPVLAMAAPLPMGLSIPSQEIEHSPDALSPQLIRLVSSRTNWERVPPPNPEPIEFASPEPTPLPPPDPALELRRYRLTGTASTNELLLALMEKDGQFIQLSVGDELAGFVLTEISGKRATFRKAASKVVLTVQ